LLTPGGSITDDVKDFPTINSRALALRRGLRLQRNPTAAASDNPPASSSKSDSSSSSSRHLWSNNQNDKFLK
jgi:hypothetical protein